MIDLSMNDKMVLVQHVIEKYENEQALIEKLKAVLTDKEIQQSIDTLIGTQRVRRIGTDVLQNNTSHTELPQLTDNLKPIIENL